MILNPERWKSLLPVAFHQSGTVSVNICLDWEKKNLSQRGKFDKLILHRCGQDRMKAWRTTAVPQSSKSVSPSNTSPQSGERKSCYPSPWWVWVWRGLRLEHLPIGDPQPLALTLQEEKSTNKNWTSVAPTFFSSARCFCGLEIKDYKCESR